jgi:DNA helicase HerA-like ATPase
MDTSVSSPGNIQQLLQFLERRHLDRAVPPAKSVWGARIERMPYLRVLGQARFWEGESNRLMGYENHMEDLITGFHGEGFTFAYLILGHERGMEVYIGLNGAGAESLLAPTLQGTFPGISLAAQVETNLGTRYQGSGIYNLIGRMSGIPTRKSGGQAFIKDREGSQSRGRSDESGRVEQIERLLRALYGEEWGYLVWAAAIPDAETLRVSNQRLSDLTQLSARINSQENIQATKSDGVGPNSTITESRSQTVDRTDHWAQYATDLLEHDHQRHQMGKMLGMWKTDVFYFAAKPAVLNKARALLKAIFAGEDSRPDPVRTINGESGAPAPSTDPFSTDLTSGEVATLCQLPREEFPGYQVTDYARFDVDVPAPAADSVAIGKIIDGGRPTGDWFSIERADLAKHGLIVGVTGSGKTNTIFHILDNLWNQGKGTPFLVIEPAKAEYRDLLKRNSFKSSLQIYTLGDERIAPFRINPFAFEIATADNRVHVQTHIDHLKSVFNAAFILYAPMPYVLETCLHEIYQDKGWDLTTSQNRRLPAQERGKEYKWAVFPTLTDLYNKIDEVVDRLGYEERIERDVKAGLKTRIGSLRLGGKGLMLDTRIGVSMSELLAKPTILELERVGNDDEKAFLIGLILTRLYEYRIVQSKSGAKLPFLQHVTVFEEAHRLLKNIKTEVGTEEANVKGQAVETFSNMLSEIRSYGEGVLIAEQIPTKLAPDAIKNTNLKIMHRVVAVDDREVMGGTMNLDETQLKVIASLEPGQAAVYAEGADSPYLIRVVRQVEKGGVPGREKTSDADVTARMKVSLSAGLYDPVPGYSQYIKVSPENMTQVRDLAQQVMLHPEFPEQFSRYFLSLVLQPKQAVYGYNSFLLFIRRAAGSMKAALERLVCAAVLLHAVERLFEQRDRRYRWFYNVSQALNDQLIGPLVSVALHFEPKPDITDQMAAQAETSLQPFVQGYRAQTKASAPFVGCHDCPAKCLYRWDVALLVRDRALERDFSSAIQNAKNDQGMWQQLAMVSSEAVKRLLSMKDDPNSKGLALCFVAQMTAGLSFSINSQRKACQNVKAALEKGK